MNIFFLTLIIFVLVYLLLNWFVKTSSAKISKGIRTFTIVLSIVLAVIMAFAGRYIFSLPFLLMILPLIKTKAGLTLLQLVIIIFSFVYDAELASLLSFMILAYILSCFIISGINKEASSN